MLQLVEARSVGQCGLSAGFHLASDPDTVRAPSLWLVSAERIARSGLDDNFFPGPPDIAVEIDSGWDSWSYFMGKVKDWLDAGTRLVWIVEPLTRTAAVFRQDGTARFIDADGVLDGEDVLPGFTLPLRDVLR